MADPRSELLQGNALEMLVLKTIAFGADARLGRSPANPAAFPGRLPGHSGGRLLPALVRMKRRGLVKTSWRVTENNRRARYYEITATGDRQLAAEACELAPCVVGRELGHGCAAARCGTRIMSLLSDLSERVRMLLFRSRRRT